MNLDEYAERLLEETLAAVAVAEDGGTRLEVFTQLIAQRLEEAGDFNDATVFFHKSRDVEVSGYALGEDDTTLHVFVTDYRAVAPPETLTDAHVFQAFVRLLSFIERSLAGYADKLDARSRAFELADLIRCRRTRLESVVLYLFSDAHARRPKMPSITLDGLRVDYQIWDLERLFRLDTSGLGREPIVVDVVARLGSPIACLTSTAAADHEVYLLIVSGDFIADLYADYGSRLLERNVRAFLQARGAVNRGIRETILQQPARFLAYNNGISATASAVGVVDSPDGGLGITRFDDLQIVNGGQTTASLYSAKKRDRADLSGVALQCKLTVVGAETIDELVPHISQFSNTQNKVTGADFSANDKFHVAVEALSRSVWAPAADGTQRQTRWFYERARGQYADELSREGTPARQRQFKLVNPTGQKFRKTDLAKFEHSWEQLPHVVSLGAEKNFRQFMLRLADRPIEPDAAYFERLVAKAILFQSCEKIVSEQKFGGYRANIVTYSIAKLVHEAAHRLDLSAIWRSQAITESTADALADISHLAHDVITQPLGTVRHIGEWSKKLDCWKRVEGLEWRIPPALERELVPLHGDKTPSVERVDRGLATVTPEEEGLIAEGAAVPADIWFAVSNWAKETHNLQSWQRSLAYSLGRLAASNRLPSLKQARQGLILLADARRLGFSVDGVGGADENPADSTEEER